MQIKFDLYILLYPIRLTPLTSNYLSFLKTHLHYKIHTNYKAITDYKSGYCF